MSSEINGFQRELGQRLWHVRLGAGLSQQEFSRRVGRSQPTIARVEAGERLADAWLVARVVEEFKCDPRWLLTGKYDSVDVDSDYNGVVTQES